MKQVKKNLPENIAGLPEVKALIQAVNASYHAFERDKEITSHAFSLSEQEYRSLNENLIRENKLKMLSIEKLKDAIRDIRKVDEPELDFDGGNLLLVADYLKQEICKRQEAEHSLTNNFQLLTTLVSNFHSGILIEDEKQKVLFVNKEFCGVFSFREEPDELAGKDFSGFTEQVKHLFSDPENFLATTKAAHTVRNRVYVDEVTMLNGKIYQRFFIPILINDVYKGHLWEYSDITEKHNFEKKLVELTNMQDAILNGTNYSIIYTDAGGTIKLFNQGAEDMLGYKAGEMVNLKSPDIFHDEQEVIKRAGELRLDLGREIKPGFDVFVEKAREGKIETREWTYIHKDGRRFPVMLSVSAIRDAGGGITGFMGIAHDLTSQKEAEVALKQSEERYRTIVENSSDIIYKTDISGGFIYVNQVAERLTGYSREELLGMKYTDLIRPDKKQETVNFYKEQLVQKRQSTYYEFPIISKNGTEKWIGQSVQLSLTSPRSAEFTALAIDITERKRYERNMQRQKEKYMGIITNMNLGLIEVDLEERIMYANPGFSGISGYSEEELMGKKATELFVRFNKETMKKKIEQRLQGVSDMYEMLVQDKRGEPRWWMISGAPNYDEKGNVTGSIGIHLDITEKKKLEKELEIAKETAEASAKAQATFLANMSHEIRTPLNGIIGMIRELTFENLKDKQRRYVQNAAVASEHLLSVLNNVLDISKIEAGELSLDRYHFLLNDVIQDVKSIMLVNANEKGLLLGIDIHKLKDNVYVGDAARLRQILLNLVGNAIKFTDKGGVYLDCTVKQTSAAMHMIRFVVEDTGIGMDESYQNKLFKKFSQEDSSISRKYGGTGLGMAITREIIQLMNGEIKLKSRKNEGTRIEITINLPVGDPEKVESPDKTIIRESRSDARVLLVEDNEFNRMVARNTLERYGYSLDEAENGQVAIELLKKKKYGIILMDLQMPVMDGFVATQEIRNKLKLKTPIVALTANAFKSELEQCQALGMNEYVTKPYDEVKLMALITRLLNQVAKEETAKPDMYTVKDEDFLYDLSVLRKQSPGNSGYVKKMVGIFIEQTKQIVPQLRAAHAKGDLDTVCRLAHRIKPSIDGMGISSLKTVVRDVEHMAKNGDNFKDLADRIAVLCSTLENVIYDLGCNIDLD